VIAKGAVESITSILATSDLNSKILQEASELAGNGIRVLAYGKSFGFIEDVFIHPSLIKKYNLTNGSSLRAKAIKT
jgi:magnesium-transporting ATPase (P-type)